MNLLPMTDLDLAGKRVLIREDLNTPLRDGAVASDARIRAALPTLELALEAGARVIVMSHLGRPVEGEADPALSLRPVADCLAQALGRPVPLLKNWRGSDWRGQDLRGQDLRGRGIPDSGPGPGEGELAMLENVRFNIGEKGNDEALARDYANLCDIFVMDAFAAAHRAQASTYGLIPFAPTACAGPLLLAELEGLEQALRNPARPLLAIVGGAKVSTKLPVLQSLAEKVDQLVPGGGIANTFLAARGQPVGQSLQERDLIPAAKTLMKTIDIPLPVDVVTAREISATAAAETKPTAEVGAEDLILDIGPRSRERLAALVAEAGTILWNGPVGVFEYEVFGGGTEALSRAIAASSAFSLAGGGDTLAAIDKYGIRDKLSHISTGGGAFLEYIEGKTLPAIAALQERTGSETA